MLSFCQTRNPVLPGGIPNLQRIGWVNLGSTPHALCNAFGLLPDQLSAAQTLLRILFYVSSLERRVFSRASDFPASCLHFIFAFTSNNT